MARELARLTAPPAPYTSSFPARGGTAHLRLVARRPRLERGRPSSSPRGRRGRVARCRSFAADAGLELDREFLAFPCVRAGLPRRGRAGDGAGIRRDVLAVPPRTARALPMHPPSASFAVWHVAPHTAARARPRGRREARMTSTAPLARPSAGRRRGHRSDALWALPARLGPEGARLGCVERPQREDHDLLVSPEDGRPQLAVKVPTTAAAERAVHAEAGLLRELGGLQLDGRLRWFRASSTGRFRGRTALVMTAVPGIPMTTAYLECVTREAPRASLRTSPL